jgi:hypothetical protein
MPWIAAGGALVGAAASIFGGQSAADAQAEAAKMQIKEQRRQYDQNRNDLAGYRNVGGQATNVLSNLYGFNGGGAQQQAYGMYQQSPGFDQALQGGLDDISTRFAGSPAGYGGGGVQKALLDYGQRARLSDFYNWRQGVTGQQGVGLQAAGQTANLGQQSANAISGAYGDMGAAQAGGYLAGAAGVNGAISNGLSLYGYGSRGGGGGGGGFVPASSGGGGYQGVWNGSGWS